MSHLEDLPTAMQIRIPIIKYGKLHNWTQTKIASECNVSRRTIYRTLEAWTKTDDFIKWAREIFADKIGKVSDKEALRAATSIIVKGMINKSEVKSEQEIIHKKVIDLENLDPEEQELVRTIARRYIKSSNKTGSPTIH